MENRLQALREQRGYTQSELWRRSGVSQSTISRLELSPGGKMETSTALQLAEALGVTLTELLPSGQPPSAATVLPRTMQAIPSDAPALLMELVDRQVEGIVRLIFQQARRNDSAPNVNDKESEGKDGYFKMKNLTLAGAREMAMA